MTPRNHILATFHGTRIARTAPSYQFDYGQKLFFPDLDLPHSYEVHFADAETGDCTTVLGSSDGVAIPDQFFLSGAPILVWIVLHAGADDGETVYKVTIPIIRRTKPTDDPPTPVEQSAIAQAIAALNDALGVAEANVAHYPKIENGTWRIWDGATETWTDTHLRAEGQATGISGITEHSDGSLTISFSNETSYRTASMRGEDGVSPQVSVAQVEGGTRVTITDRNGDHVFTVQNGSSAPYDVDRIYPVGSIYMSVNGTDPGTLFGGTWQRILDTFLLAAGTTYAPGATGGEATHTLTNAELPNVRGKITFHGERTYSPVAGFQGNLFSGTLKTGTYGIPNQESGSGEWDQSYYDIWAEFGNDQPHNNMPPYLAVYVWKRTA